MFFHLYCIDENGFLFTGVFSIICYGKMYSSESHGLMKPLSVIEVTAYLSVCVWGWDWNLGWECYEA